MILGLRFNTEKDYQYILNSKNIKLSTFFMFFIMSMIPALSGYFGFTQVGWMSLSGNIHKITEQSSFIFSIIFSLSYIVSIILSGWLIFKTRDVFNSKISPQSSLLFAYYCSLPFIAASLTLMLPYLIFNFMALLCAILYSVKILYTGLYKVAKIPPEQGFMYSSTILGGIMIGFIIWISLLTIIYINFSELFYLT